MSIQRVRQLVDEILERGAELKTLVAEDGGNVVIPSSDVTRVSPGDNVAAAFDDLQKTGGTLLCRPGVYKGVNFVARRRDETAKPVVITTDTTNLPREGQRITREFLPDLAVFNSETVAATFGTENGARRVHFRGVGFGPTPFVDRTLVALGGDKRGTTTFADIPVDFIFDRVVMFGMDQRGQHQGLRANARNVVIGGSSFYDFVEPGRDSQAGGGWNGSIGHVLENCYLEASAENWMYGGSDPASAELNPRDVVIRRCHFAKNPVWKTWPNAGGNVKAIFEVKNIKNLRMEACIFERNWKKNWPSAVAICIKCSNQEGTAPFTWCEDVEIVDCIVRDCGTVIQLQGFGDGGKATQRQRNIKFRNILAYNLNTNPEFMGEAKGVTAAVVPDTLELDHCTMIGNRHSFHAFWFHMGQGRGTSLKWTNSIMWEGTYGVVGSTPVAADVVEASTPGFGFNSLAARGYQNVDFRGNAVAAGGRVSTYPAGNARLTDAEIRGSLDPLMRVRAGSAIATQVTTTDGKPCGADVDILRARIGDVI